MPETFHFEGRVSSALSFFMSVQSGLNLYVNDLFPTPTTTMAVLSLSIGTMCTWKIHERPLSEFGLINIHYWERKNWSPMITFEHVISYAAKTFEITPLEAKKIFEKKLQQNYLILPWNYSFLVKCHPHPAEIDYNLSISTLQIENKVVTGECRWAQPPISTMFSRRLLGRK